MKITTRNFGEIEINSEDIINFNEGLPGFPECKDFVVLFQEDEEIAQEGTPFNTICFLQSIDDGELSFVLVDMTAFLPEYRPLALVEYARENVGEFDPDALVVYNILTVYDELSDSTANLKAPIIIDFVQKKGRQIICQGDEYPIRAKIFEARDDDKAGEE
ncbi:MAG: flagellar assembly protein FliW [Clostridiales bacterium]|jgi:flagellar assembly factor FliW|nr:flagellar assembly protein FliW [Clostridiales bacterium]